MSFDGGEKQWKCVAPVSFQRVSSIVRDIGEPCLYQSPLKVVSAVRISALLFLFWSSICVLQAMHLLKLIKHMLSWITGWFCWTLRWGDLDEYFLSCFVVIWNNKSCLWYWVCMICFFLLLIYVLRRKWSLLYVESCLSYHLFNLELS